MPTAIPSTGAATPTPLDWGNLDPLECLRRWPRRRPVVLLHSGGAGRWSMLAAPRRRLAIAADPPRAGLRRLSACLDALPLAEAQPPCADAPPFSGGWCVSLGFALGRWFEPSAISTGAAAALDDRGWPAALLAECAEGLAFDHATRRWWWFGGTTPQRWALDLPDAPPLDATASLDPPRSEHPPARFREAVARTIELIHAGDLFQANVAQRFLARLVGSPRAFAARALAASGADHGAFQEWLLPRPGGGHERRAILSLSPELFLQIDGAGRIVTRPIKGTRPASATEASLRDDPKDAAELAMIVDLMRNDLGRVCELGSIEVVDPRRIERHPTVLHGVAEIAGTLRRGLRATDLMAATFPPGSVTGAPKVRALQVIDELEPVARGPYCGAIGWFDRRHGARLSVAIRTATLRPVAANAWALDYLAGCGIVAESDPAAEAQESLDKTAVLQHLAT
jgi:para-aminobenzoate synthetase component 1